MMRTPTNAARSRDTNGGSLRPNDRRGFRIGPKIRVGGSLGHLGQQVKLGTGKLLSNKLVDSALALIPGVGPGISAAANVAGHVLDTSHGGIHSAGDVGNIAVDAGKAYLGGKAANIARDGIGSVVKHGVKTLAGGLTSAKKLITGGGSDGKGNLGVVGDVAGTIGGDGGRNGVLDKLLLAAGVGASAADKLRQQKMQDQATKYVTDSYSTRAPLRTQGQTMALNPATPELSNIFSNPGNVYDAQKRGTVGPRVPVRHLSY